MSSRKTKRKRLQWEDGGEEAESEGEVYNQGEEKEEEEEGEEEEEEEEEVVEVVDGEEEGGEMSNRLMLQPRWCFVMCLLW